MVIHLLPHSLLGEVVLASPPASSADLNFLVEGVRIGLRE